MIEPWGEKEGVEEELKDAIETVDVYQDKVQKVKRKYEKKLANAREEIEDLTEEFERDRIDLLDMIRDQNRELKLWEQVISQVFSTKEIRKIWEKSEWDEENEEWILPRLKPKNDFGGGGGPDFKLPSISSQEGEYPPPDSGRRRMSRDNMIPPLHSDLEQLNHPKSSENASQFPPLSSRRSECNSHRSGNENKRQKSARKDKSDNDSKDGSEGGKKKGFYLFFHLRLNFLKISF